MRRAIFQNSSLARITAFAAPWALLAVVSFIQAWRHWRVQFPFGVANLCGHLQSPHCAWCATGLVGALATAAVIFLGLRRPPADFHQRRASWAIRPSSRY